MVDSTEIVAISVGSGSKTDSIGTQVSTSPSSSPIKGEDIIITGGQVSKPAPTEFSPINDECCYLIREEAHVNHREILRLPLKDSERQKLL